MKQAFADLVGSFFPQIDYLAFYPGTLKAMSTDKTKVDVDPDNKKILPGVGSIRLKLGMPGATVDVEPTPGSRVLIGFEEGDPSKPYALLWEQGEHVNHTTFTADKITLNASGAQPSARKGDKLSSSAALATWAGVIEAALSAAGQPVPPSSQFSNVANPTPPGAANNLGAINQGSSTVEVGS